MTYHEYQQTRIDKPYSTTDLALQHWLFFDFATESHAAIIALNDPERYIEWVKSIIERENREFIDADIEMVARDEFYDFLRPV